MTEKTDAQLRAEVDALRTELSLKAAKNDISSFIRIDSVKQIARASDTSKIATEDFVKQETATKFWEFFKGPEVLAIFLGWAILKLELTPFVNFDPAIENWLKKHDWERNRFGMLMKLNATELERRANVVAAAERRLVDMETGIRRLTRLTLDSRTRLRELGRKVAALETRSASTRQAVRDIPGSPEMAVAATRTARLQAQVNLLSAALA
ncbi:hypothetical protein LUW75_08850 [Streptomyces sp. MRC013]|uniref:hypothetical protein n=1 Tax=Streptomyces sp. MRC013 TaxID=2898276 RepID=UPI0020270F43|nr:hypothetical protein [Streptomyces sp. MRC013]URM90080.1 hypothetical protein LUW75_08850 [Streptomyces sp. MRC013]